MNNVQSGILSELPRLARYLLFSLKPDIKPGLATELLHKLNHEQTVVGLGHSLLAALTANVDGMKSFPAHSGPALVIPATPAALWIWLQGDDRGELLHRSREIEHDLAAVFRLDKVIDAFQYRDGRDLTGYEDGTENPVGDEAVAAGTVQGLGEGMDGSSFVAVQQWTHELDHFQSLPGQERDNIIGRRISDNEEIEEAPLSAHVKRTAQEDFDPEAFVLRRSMPWTDDRQAGLVFVAFGRSFDAFEALLNRMVGKDDGITDALFRFSRPVSGSYFWCPPVKDGRLDLRALQVNQ